MIHRSPIIAHIRSLETPVEQPTPRPSAHCDRGAMAAQWPQGLTWPTPIREHATRVSTYLQDTLGCIERTNSQSVPADLHSRHGDIHPESPARPRSQHPIQQNTNTGEEAREAAREDVGKAVIEITREIKTKGLRNQINAPVSYAAIAARSHILAGAYNT
ncbi:hypothetical protein BDV96DRAFT_638964 [Lophiotrema nucula]|uniref:Uncharacterized protein n=1 Tax=Lophiotrema nucula TaxID=690887 RepID=A0A6A5YEE0_9PLEO|nr:hypothetical protein BDV96DRAFT_638964 [Lophiotrema nucula]